ncbi:hypothetical protein [Candidatus Cetobacterium colombiensis]|uniref:DUF3847 domain-containing protein n=1 Tax=Candidatus Cetobacterium colombiensis TaxID=3073100 RepID=A0ABU4WD64_9FUSO|nr:hypothetical protein [Candidatus Cetobacterium colombiensis]MDX8337468.1 hypothetical protein [Candidatus Cetobacterium colombiensis]
MIENNFNEQKKKKTIAELKEEIRQQKQKAIREANKKIKALEKREKEQKLKPYFKLVEKCIDNISDKDLEIMIKYVESKFKK